jgi:hypothetical protein
MPGPLVETAINAIHGAQTLGEVRRAARIAYPDNKAPRIGMSALVEAINAGIHRLSSRSVKEKDWRKLGDHYGF